LTSVYTGYATFLTCKEGILSITCKYLDPAIVGGKILNKAYGVILMSGTLPPTDYIKSMLGIYRHVRELRIPFRDYVGSSNIEAVIYTEVTTRYSERCENMYSRIGKVLSEIYRNVKDGAILSVFPSYTVLKTVRRYIDSDVDYIMEVSSTTISQVLDRLRENPHILIMAVAGGKLMEGVEFKIDGRNILKSVVIVGVPYPEPNDFLEMFRGIVSTRLGSSELAWELVYMWNALTKVKQAIGRAIRSENDRAFIILMDRRYLDSRLRKFIEDYLGNVEVTNNIDDMLIRLRRFLNSN